MRLKLTIGAVVLLLSLIAVNCAGYYKERSEKITAVTEVLLQSRDFEMLYESLDENAKSLTPKAEFLERANRLVGYI